MAVDKFVEVVEELNKFISFRTNAALTAKQLPTLAAVAERLQARLSVALGDDDATAIRAGLLVSAQPNAKKNEGNLAIMATGTDKEMQAVVTFLCETKEVNGVLAARGVALLENKSGAESLSKLVRLRLEQRQAAAIFDLWDETPLFFQEQHPICPACGESVYISSFDEYQGYHMFCSCCDWYSKDSLGDYGEVKGEYVREWYKKERAWHLKAAAKQQKVCSATIELQAATRKLLALGLDKNGITKIIDDVCKEGQK